MVFIGGVGRSGTHFIARYLQRHKQTHLRMEKPRTFRPITQLATRGFEDDLYQKVLRRLKWQKAIHRKLVVEKSHPSIWLAERLLKDLPNSRFVCTRRPVLQVVNSMLNHEGVLKWYDVLPLDKENPFLGISEENVAEFESLPLHLKCTWKWISHHQRISDCVQAHPANFRVWEFENLVGSPEKSMEDLCDFIGVQPTTFGETPDTSSLFKYQNLSELQRSEICALVEEQSLS